MSSLFATLANRFFCPEDNCYTVTNVKVNDYRFYEVVTREDSLILHSCSENRTIHYAIVLCLANDSINAFRVYRSTDFDQCQLYFLRLKDKLPILANFTQCCEKRMLQKICDYINENPTENIAHIAAAFGILDYFQTYKNDLTDVINSQDEYGRAPLMIAIEKENLNIIEFLLSLPIVSLDFVTTNGNNILHTASKTTGIIVSKLCNALTNFDNQNETLLCLKLINSRNNCNKTPLYQACYLDKADCVKELLKFGADANGASIDDLVLSPSDCGTELINNLDVSEIKKGGNPIHWVKSAKVIQLLVEMNCNLNARNFDSNSALHLYVERQKIDLVVALLSCGAEVDIIGQNGNTPLHLAVKSNNVPLVQTLLVFGANPDILNEDNQTARHLASLEPVKNEILYMLHSVRAKRCQANEELSCPDGCHPEKDFNGIPPESLPTNLSPFYSKILLNSTIQEALKITESINDDENKPSNKMKILCLDGGGIRGLIMIQILNYIETITNKKIIEIFDWIAGTSTGGIIALLLCNGYSASQCRNIYFKLKDEVFVGSSPYSVEKLEQLLKDYLGSEKRINDITKPRLTICSTDANSFPLQAKFFRNYLSKNELMDNVESENQYLWEIARASSAAPTYFDPFESFLDGGLISNNPTLDILTEIQYLNNANRLLNREDDLINIKMIVSIGTGFMPVTPIDPLSLKYTKLFSMKMLGLPNYLTCLTKILVEQATQSSGRVVERAEAWCSMNRIPYFRINPSMSNDIKLDSNDNQLLINALWETMDYITKNDDDMNKLFTLLILN